MACVKHVVLPPAGGVGLQSCFPSPITRSSRSPGGLSPAQRPRRAAAHPYNLVMHSQSAPSSPARGGEAPCTAAASSAVAALVSPRPKAETRAKLQSRVLNVMSSGELHSMHENLSGIAAILMHKGLNISTPAPPRCAAPPPPPVAATIPDEPPVELPFKRATSTNSSLIMPMPLSNSAPLRRTALSAASRTGAGATSPER